jgi:hypothetical protein
MNSKYQPEMGKMPRPGYIIKAWDSDTVNEDETIKWIGMKAYSMDREIKDFLWWKNFLMGDLKDDKIRTDAARVIAAIKLKMEADLAIGLPIDLEKSNSRTGYVEVIKKPHLYGVYVESKNRPMFNFMVEFENLSEAVNEKDLVIITLPHHNRV